MLFNSLTFLVFFLAVFTIFWALPNWRARKILLLAASYCFYAAWSPPFVLLLAASSWIDWSLARRIAQAQDAGLRKMLVAASIAVNLLLLGYFKYGGFLLENFVWLLAQAGIAYAPAQSNIVLPLGISFYTFASISYIVDVYRREIDTQWSLLDYALFVGFFPHLVAGPIVRGKCLLPQFANPALPSSNKVGWGLTLVTLGSFIKIVLADSILAPTIEEVYAAPARFGAPDVWAAVLGFSGQIYFDFAGYSMCAIGIALCFGFSFPDNFVRPYGARGFSDFWRRWHVSLSSWLRDYLYIPLGGGRYGVGKTCRNLLIVMLIGGLWHGASWMFVLWGGLHGLCLIAERAFLTPGKDNGPALQLPLTLLTFALVTLMWIPFRSPDGAAAWEILKGLLRFSAPTVNAGQNLIVTALMVVTLAWQIGWRDMSFENGFAKLGGVLQFAIIATCMLSIFLVSGGDARAFIYFQF
jgi:D-alanyl-lipoteichoic acid acyltransferase DltB (MBOAT superfamily)